MLKKNVFKVLLMFVFIFSLSACGELLLDPYGKLPGQQLPDNGAGDNGAGDNTGGGNGGGNGDGNGGNTGDNGNGDNTGGGGNGDNTGGDEGDGSGGGNSDLNPEIFKPFAPELYFGRSKLNATEQKAYDVILDALLNYKGEVVPGPTAYNESRLKIDLEGNDIKTINSDQIKKILNIMMDDESRIFNLSSAAPMAHGTDFSSNFTLTNEGGISYFYVRLMSTLSTAEKYKSEMNEIEVNVKRIIDIAKAKKAAGYTDAQIAAVLYEEYLAGVAYGGMGSAYAGNLRGSFKYFSVDGSGRHVVVCEGYARAYLYLLQRMGIKAIFIGGAAVEEGKGDILHAWNKVQIDGKWYNADPTWDDYRGASTGSGKDDFLKSDNTFSKNHSPNKDTNGKPYGYAVYGITLPASNPTDFPESGYAR